MARPTLVWLLALLAWGDLAAQEIVRGKATPIQADQISVGGRRISIFGVDAPDPDQDRECRFNGMPFGCYSNARRFLATLLDLGEVTCTDTGRRNYVQFAYMTCLVNGQDLGAELVKAGHALAFRPQSDRYVPEEAAAKAAKLGIWQAGVSFTVPWTWRESNNRPLLGP